MENNQVDIEAKKKRTTKTIIIIVAVVLFFGFIFLIGAGAITYFVIKGNKGGNVVDLGGGNFPGGQQGYPDQQNFPQGEQQQNPNPLNVPQTGQYNPQTGTFQQTPSTVVNPEMPPTMPSGGGLQTINPIDKQVGLAPFSISIPQGWTHELQSNWNKDAMPMVSVMFSASEPNGAGKFFITPMRQFMEFPMEHPSSVKVMKPREAFEFLMNQSQQSDPQFAQKQYKIVNVMDVPEQGGNGQQLYGSDILAEFVENGIQKSELVRVTVTVASNPQGGKVWALMWAGIQDKKGVPVEQLSARLMSILQSQRPNQEWGQKVNEVTSGWMKQKQEEMTSQMNQGGGQQPNGQYNPNNMGGNGY